jgi:hypothetical protein
VSLNSERLSFLKNFSCLVRYSIVVLNWNDSSSTSWNPQSVAATIEFRGLQVGGYGGPLCNQSLNFVASLQAKYTFPVGVTTLWWYAANQGHSRRGNETFVETTVYAEHDGKPAAPRKMRWERN